MKINDMYPIILIDFILNYNKIIFLETKMQWTRCKIILDRFALRHMLAS